MRSCKKLGELNPIKPERRPFQKIFCDHVGPLPKSNGMEHIIVLMDGLTKFVLLDAVESTNAEGVIKFLTKVFAQTGENRPRVEARVDPAPAEREFEVVPWKAELREERARGGEAVRENAPHRTEIRREARLGDAPLQAAA